MSIDWVDVLIQSGIAAVLSSAVLIGVLQIVFHRRTERIAAEVRQEFQRRTEEISSEVKQAFEEQSLRYRSNMAWKEQSLAELLGPVNMQLDRAHRAFKRWNANNHYLEDQIIREGNTAARNLLLNNGHLIPRDLLDDAGLLIGHYDRWLEQFNKVRGPGSEDSDIPFVFTYDFPGKSAQRFQERFRTVWEELYSTGQPGDENSSGPVPEGGATAVLDSYVSAPVSHRPRNDST